MTTTKVTIGGSNPAVPDLVRLIHTADDGEVLWVEYTPRSSKGGGLGIPSPQLVPGLVASAEVGGGETEGRAA